MAVGVTQLSAGTPALGAAVLGCGKALMSCIMRVHRDAGIERDEGRVRYCNQIPALCHTAVGAAHTVGKRLT